MKKLSKYLFFIFFPCILFLILSWEPSLNAATGTYYLDSKTGSDLNAGTSPVEAWKSLEKLNTISFKPGDKIFLKSGSRFEGHLAPKGSGTKREPIILQSYGKDEKPLLEGKGHEPETLLLYNVEYWEVKDLEITNLGKEREPYRAGVRVKLENFGTAHHIHLKNLTVRDVNGSLVKKEGGGTGITCDNSGDRRKSRFDGLHIEDCYLFRTDRDGIAIRSSHKTRDEGWFPNLNVVIRNNLLEDIGGDGIVPRGCDGALVEYNVLRGGRTRCDDYAAGIWPHSSDNTVIQFNEVSGMVGTKDGQGFDSDYNCTNTLIQYNYSHDNEGGFMLICNSGTGLPDNIGNQGTVIRYNISQNDGHRIFYITGPVKDVQIYNNTIYTGPDLDIEALWPGGGNNGYAENVLFANNVFYVDGRVTYHYGGLDVLYSNNAFHGKQLNAPDDANAYRAEHQLKGVGTGFSGFGSLEGYKLKPGSPLISAGKSINDKGERDFWGNRLKEDKAASIGAHSGRE